MKASRLSALLVCGAILCAAGTGFAQPVSPVGRADAYFQQALTLKAQKKYDEACPLFAESQRLDPQLGTQLNLAICYDEAGRTTSAFYEYRAVAELAERRGPSEKERADYARDRAKALTGLASHIVVKRGRDAPGLKVTLDGVDQALAVLAAPLPVDPGTHELAATAPGYEGWSQKIVVERGGGDVPVNMPELGRVATPPAPVPVPAAPAPSPTPLPVRPPSPEPHGNAGAAMRTGAYASFGVGGAALVLGAITGGLSLSATKGLERDCPNKNCGPDHYNDLSRATTLANVANVGFALAGVGALVGGILLGTAPSDERAAAVEPFAAGDAGAGVRLRF